MVIEINAAFPIEWGKEYYTVEKTAKNQYAPCLCCDNTGKVTIKGVEYTCPRCKGNWREKEIVGTTVYYYVAKWQLKNIEVNNITGINITLCFFRVNKGKGDNRGILEISERDFCDMISRNWGRGAKIYNDYKEALAEVKRLNAMENVKGDAEQ